MSNKQRYKVLVYIGDRDISKYTDSLEQAKSILQRMKDAAATLSLMHVFRGEIHEINN